MQIGFFKFWRTLELIIFLLEFQDPAIGWLLKLLLEFSKVIKESPFKTLKHHCIITKCCYNMHMFT
jgi:hypothetical protein